MDTKIEQEMDAISKALSLSKKVKLPNGKIVNLSTEVIWSAMRAIKENPQLTISQAINCGLNEWDK